MTIGEIASYRRGSFPQPYGDSRWYGGINAIPFVQVADVAESGMRLNETTKQQISELAMPKSIFVPKGTVIVSLQGSIGRVAINLYDSYVEDSVPFLNNKRLYDKTIFALSN
jgi:type I restriction enzyme S subunit